MSFSFKRIKQNKKLIQGFTLIELVVSIAIFAFMTTFLVSKYGNSNQGVLITNLAYDIALAVRQAQSYGVNTKQATFNCVNYYNNTLTDSYQCGYGVYFVGTANKQFVFFADINGNGIYDNGEALNTYAIKRGNFIRRLCRNVSCSSTSLDVSVLFVRPNPDAIMTVDSGAGPTSYLKIELESPNQTRKYIVIRATGQISIED